MYEKHMSTKVGIRQEFADGAKAFIKNVPRVTVNICAHIDDQKIRIVRPFFDVVQMIDQRYCNESQLFAVAGVMNIKAENNMLKRCYDQVSQWTSRLLPCDQTLSPDYAVLIEKMDVQINQGLEPSLVRCKKSLYVVLRLVEAWRHFNRTHKHFALKPRNVRLGIDGFASHGQYGLTYLCWLVILTSYSVLPRICMKSEYIFLTMVIPGLSNPKHMIDMYVKLLIEELLQLCNKLILVAFNVMLPEHMWSLLTKVNLLFQVLCSATLDVAKGAELDDNVVVKKWNLVKIFLLAFFDLMKYLIIHLPYKVPS
ncbi:hypothetical protein Sango_2930700 [Sesamum angolense]|uniref:Uncharacterized protein n=1 Tax=Sesamum angolense TaxID=2727404 RepID=A0AAE1T5Z0_9LAMI|nr:hypothetical protein Sango_2930700 [Sesamum angolense]